MNDAATATAAPSYASTAPAQAQTITPLTPQALDRAIAAESARARKYGQHLLADAFAALRPYAMGDMGLFLDSADDLLAKAEPDMRARFSNRALAYVADIVAERIDHVATLICTADSPKDAKYLNHRRALMRINHSLKLPHLGHERTE